MSIVALIQNGLSGPARVERVTSSPIPAAALIARKGWDAARCVEVPPAVLDAPGAYYWDGAAVLARPTLPAPPALTAGVAANWALPEGAVVTVDPLNGAAPVTETVADAFSIGLASGAWRILVNPPFPYLAAEWHIEVAS